jgi:hypothetical protein
MTRRLAVQPETPNAHLETRSMTMPKSIRIALAIVVGFVAWFAVATLGNLILRAILAGYGDVERAMTFTPTMLVARLVLGIVSSVAAGLACTAVARAAPRTAYLLAAALVVFFLPVHHSLWARFPVWYHAAFLISLVPGVLFGARLARPLRLEVQPAA